MFRIGLFNKQTTKEKKTMLYYFIVLSTTRKKANEFNEKRHIYF